MARHQPRHPPVGPPGAAELRERHYSLFRAIIPALWAASSSFPHGDRSVGAATSVVYYLQYLQQHVLDPIGVTDAGECSSDEPALAYSVTADDFGRLVERHNDCGGASGLHLSAMDLARFLAFLVHSDVLLSPTGRALIHGYRLGWNDGSNRFESVGVFWHAGAYWSPAGRNGRQELNTCVMKFPYGLQASVVVNSRIFDGRDVCGIVLDAYRRALP